MASPFPVGRLFWRFPQESRKKVYVEVVQNGSLVQQRPAGSFLGVS
jgi:hypothetical protein